LCQRQKKEMPKPQPCHFSPSSFSSSEWNYEDQILFESLLVRFTPNEENRWRRIASMMSNKTAEQIEEYYEKNYRDILHKTDNNNNQQHSPS
jgi:hypothetical protein